LSPSGSFYKFTCKHHAFFWRFRHFVYLLPTAPPPYQPRLATTLLGNARDLPLFSFHLPTHARARTLPAAAVDAITLPVRQHAAVTRLHRWEPVKANDTCWDGHGGRTGTLPHRVPLTLVRTPPRIALHYRTNVNTRYTAPRCAPLATSPGGGGRSNYLPALTAQSPCLQRQPCGFYLHLLCLSTH